ncbi:D-serine ammonia-lyase DSD1 [Saccharomyces eubayanus]|uniref:D-serine ammonia-lyase DSD1 n=1 Tax=Saccharomyces eubayanus TaxID=1080349 RepID=UPI0006C36357|nr:DSD1-like protein [Saccharomyces eubayanus]KOG99333.1 DSD1-like protein [Saccharomyces eubayanus]
MSDILSQYKGCSIQNLPTPSFIIDEEKFDRNCTAMLNNVESLSQQSGLPIKFRAHVKTHKTAKGTLKQLGHGLPLAKRTTKAILVSTLKEAVELLDYQDRQCLDYIDDISYSLPCCVPEFIPLLSNLSRRVDNFQVFVDNIEHLENLRKFGRPASGKKWSIFIKVDMGTHRAGLAYDSSEFLSLLTKLASPEIKEVVELYGFYAHAGHSYSSTTINDTQALLIEEIKAVNKATQAMCSVDSELDASKLTLSVGATPTSNSLKLDNKSSLIKLITEELTGQLEIHCGNYCMYDLQQVATGCVQDYEIAGFVLGTVLSSYPSRGEMLSNTGVMSLSREASSIKGFGICVDLQQVLKFKEYSREWYVARVSQEHGILKPTRSWNEVTPLSLGTKFAILPQHACITMGQFENYFVVDSKGIVTDVWAPFQKW